MSPLSERHALHAVASPTSEPVRARLLGADTTDAFAKQTSHVVDRLAAELAESPDGAPGPPARLGAFRVVAPLGRGGMGTVYRGVHETTGKVAALKTAPAGTELGELLHQEALALGGLDHRGVVQIFDHGEQDGVVWIAMQLVHGETLRTKIARRWPRPGAARTPLTREEQRRWLAWFRDFAIALGAIHARGVVHRDIKPANLMIADDGAPYVIDFGLSLDGPEHAVIDTLAGTVPYMSPEQVLALTQLDGRTDVYSLGACLFEALGGVRLVGDESARIGLLRQVAFGETPRLSEVAPWMDRACDAVLARALAKDVNLRYASAREFADDLERLMEGRDPRHARSTWVARVQRHRVAIVTSLIFVSTTCWFAARAWNRSAELAEFRASAARAVELGEAGADDAVRVLERALELAPERGGDSAFQDAYGKALSDFAPMITRRLFQRATLVPAHMARATPAGRIGAMAKRHLGEATRLPVNIRCELIVQALLMDLLARQQDPEFLRRAASDADRDERIQQLVAVTNVLAGRQPDSDAVARARSRDFANLELDKLCCRAFLLVEMSDRSDAPFKDEMARLTRELEDRMRAPETTRDWKNFPAGLAALMHLRAHEPAAAEDLFMSRLADSATGPTPTERPAFQLLAAAARFRRLVSEPNHPRAAMDAVVERFAAAMDAEPRLATRFAVELRVDPGALVEGSDPAFGAVAAEFFDALVTQDLQPRTFTSSLAWLLHHAAWGWAARHPRSDDVFVPGDWEMLLRVADWLGSGRAELLIDTTDDSDIRWLFATVIDVAGRPECLASPNRQRYVERCASYRAIAASSLPPPRWEIDFASAVAALHAQPADPGALSSFRIRSQELRAARATVPDDHPLAALWDEQLDSVDLIERQSSKQTER